MVPVFFGCAFVFGKLTKAQCIVGVKYDLFPLGPAVVTQNSTMCAAQNPPKGLGWQWAFVAKNTTKRLGL
jgi:hypothetical protein